MPHLALPDVLIARFRSVAAQRLRRIEAAWGALRGGRDRQSSSEELRRELHTLKGEARSVGFADVDLICHKVEELVERAEHADFRVSDNYDLMVVSALQFMAMLVRKQPGKSFGGIDLPGFLRQIEEVLRESERPRAAQPTSGAHIETELSDRVLPSTAFELAATATRVYLESLVAAGTTRTRLEAIWRDLSARVRTLQAVSLAPVLERHAQFAVELGHDLGKQIHIDLALDDVRLSPRIVDGLDGALLHLLRNAVDHGIEAAGVRRRRGKPTSGKITIHARATGRGAVVVVEDDGGGIDLDAVRRRASTGGFLAPQKVAGATESELLALLFRPGFSTARTVTDVSGRGVGLDAVEGTLRSVGARLEVAHRAGFGTRLTITVDDIGWNVAATLARSARSGVVVALDPQWEPEVDLEPNWRAPDVLELLGLLEPDVGPCAVPAVLVSAPSLRLGVSGELIHANVERLCPTAPNEPAEVVRCGRQIALWLRPDALARSQSAPT